MLFYGSLAANEYIRTSCLTKQQIQKNTNEKGFVKNSDGTVSVYKYNDSFELYPVALTLQCCKVLDPTYYFDINTQTCRWAQPHDTCGFSEPINLIVNPKGDDGTLFFVDDFEKETCDLKISFDYLLKIKCEDLLNIVNPTITTNIQSQETIKQTVSLQMEIESVNTEIETITNEVVLLNEEYLDTPYSIECKQFPIITPPGPCLRPPNLPVVNFLNTYNFDNTSIQNFESSNATACNAALYNKNTNVHFNGQDNNVTKFAVGGTVYNNIRTNCDLYWDGHFITNIDTREVTHVVNGVIQSISICPDPTAAPALKQNLSITPFDNTAFVSPTESRIDYMTKYGIKPLFQYYNPNFITITDFESFATLDNSIDYTTRYGGIKPIYQTYNPNFIRPTEFDTYISWDPTDSYTSVNYCLTDLGLQTWETILKTSGGDYQLFLQGDSANPGYTCADVITLSNQPNAGDLFYDCTIPFGTKSSIKLKINQHMTELSLLSETLTNLQDELIKLQNTFIETTDSNKGCDTMIDALESFDIEMHLDIVNADNTITSVFSAATFPAINSTTNLYDYLIKNPNSGFYICGDPSNNNVGFSACTSLSLDNDVTPNVDSCDSIIDDLIDGLNKVPGSDITKISNSAFSSEWLSYTKVISDSKIIDLIKNKKIKISFKVKFSCVDFCLLLDNIVLDKSCKNVDRNDIIISQNPGFELKRVIDNKKSWIDTTVPTNREFFVSKSNGTNPIRQTDYNVNDERLVINSKEIDLDISVASAIETDVWCYLNDNPCLLSGATLCDITYPINTTTFLGADVVLLDETVGEYDLEYYETCYRSLRNGWLSAIDDSNFLGNDTPMREWLADNLVIENISCGRLFKFNCGNFIFLEKDNGCTDLYAENYLLGVVKFYDEPMSNFISVFIKDYNNAILSIITIEETFILKNNCPELSYITYPINTTTFLGDNVVLLETSIGYNDITDFWTCHRQTIDALIQSIAYGNLPEWLADNLVIEYLSYGRLFKFLNCGFIFLEKDYGCTDLYSQEFDNDMVYLSKILDVNWRYLEMRNFINTFITDFNSKIITGNIDNDYILKNNCPDLCGKKCGDTNLDFNSLLMQPISGITTIQQFENVMTTELIDVKNRQTITSYPTLRAVYDRYLNSSDYCGTVSSAFDYQNMDRFAGLIGNYWIDLIEQVVPSTTIWGSVKIYTNTIFDEQKFKYKSYSSLLCKNPFVGQKVLSPINGVSGQCQGVNVIYKDLLAKPKTKTDDSYTTNLVGERVMMSSESDQAVTSSFDLEDYPTTKPIIDRCDNLCIAQMNSGSEFISYIQLPTEPGCGSDLYRAQSSVNECTLNVTIKGTYINTVDSLLEAITIGGTTPFTYLWSNGETTKTITVPTTLLYETNYSVIVTDSNCCTARAQEGISRS